MERKMNQEIRNYRAAMFMGLSLRQCICSALAIGASVWIYMTFQNSLSQDVISWLCILGAAPFALMGFFTWHGMSAEKALAVILRDIFAPRVLPWKTVNYARLANQRRLEAYIKEVHDRGIEHIEEHPGQPEGTPEGSQNGAEQHPHHIDL